MGLAGARWSVPFAQRAPKGAVELLGHDFYYGDAVSLGRAAAVPETPTRRPQEAGRTAKIFGHISTPGPCAILAPSAPPSIRARAHDASVYWRRILSFPNKNPWR